MAGNRRRKLLVASVGLATVNYTTVSCFDFGSTSGNLVAPPSVAGANTISSVTGVGGSLANMGGTGNTGDGTSSESATNAGATTGGVNSNGLTSGSGGVGGGGAGGGADCAGGAGGEREGAAGAAGECAD